jgi:hypothetical protein
LVKSTSAGRGGGPATPAASAGNSVDSADELPEYCRRFANVLAGEHLAEETLKPATAAFERRHGAMPVCPGRLDGMRPAQRSAWEEFRHESGHLQSACEGGRHPS